METSQPFVGIDVSSQTSGRGHSAPPPAPSEPNNGNGVASLTAQLKALNPRMVLLEDHRGLRDAVTHALYEAGLPVVLADPQTSPLAKAIGRLARTDRLDTQVSPSMPRGSPPGATLPGPGTAGVGRYRDPPAPVAGIVVMEENRRRTCAQGLRRHRVVLGSFAPTPEDLDRDLQVSIRRPRCRTKTWSPPELHRRRPRVSASLIAEVPELGTLPG